MTSLDHQWIPKDADYDIWIINGRMQHANSVNRVSSAHGFQHQFYGFPWFPAESSFRKGHHPSWINKINEHLLSGIVVRENTDDLGKNNNIISLSFNVLGKNKSRTFKDIRDDEGCVNNPPGEPRVNIVRSCSTSVSGLGSYPFADCVQFFDVFRFFCVKIATL